MYRVRYVTNDCKVDHYVDCSSYDDAVDKFLFYVRTAVVLNANIRSVQIFYFRKRIKVFQNY